MGKKYNDDDLELREPGTVEALYHAAMERARWLREDFPASKFVGIDPGKTGGIVLLDAERSVMARYTFSRVSPGFAIWSCDDRYNLREATDVLVEEVHSMPKQGVKSMFSFGQAYGEILGALQTRKIPYRGVNPLRWQTSFRRALREPDEDGRFNREKKEDRKERLYQVAKLLFPDQKMSKQMADAFLIAHWAWGGGTDQSVMGKSIPVSMT